MYGPIKGTQQLDACYQARGSYRLEANKMIDSWTRVV